MMETKKPDASTLLELVKSEAACRDAPPGPSAETPPFMPSGELNRAPEQFSAKQMPSRYSPFEASPFHAAHPVSISLPVSPSAFDIVTPEVELGRPAVPNMPHGLPRPPCKPNTADVKFELPGKMMFRSQPIPGALPHAKAPQVYACPPSPGTGCEGPRDRRYDSFKTWSGKLERQLTQLRGRPWEPEDDDVARDHPVSTMPKVDRFFAALEGPELDKLRSSEVLALPSDKKWPFLLRFPVSAFGMCLGMSSQAILWKTIATSASTRFLHITLKINLVLWCVSIALMCILSVIYALKIIFFFEAVRREYYHPIRVNFFFAPFIACLFLATGMPRLVATDLPHCLWYVLMAPILCLEIKIYGQWMSGGQRRLSKVANPSNHLCIVGNFVGALLGASMGLKEGPVFFFAVGLAHYTVLFVTLYQRLPTNETLPKELHPVFFLFVAAPSVACLAWARITGEFGYGSRIAYFIAMFLYASLAVRINFFRGFRFSLAWWAYTFPMTGAAIATIRYSSEVKNLFTQSLCVGLSVLATLTVTALFLTTLLHAFVLRDLFPNDISIAITEWRPKPIAGRRDKSPESEDAKDVEAAAY